MQAHEITKRILDLAKKPLDLGQVDPENLLAFIGRHRLEARLLGRLEEHRPYTCDKSLLFSLLSLRAQARERQNKHIKAMHEITSVLPSEKGLPIVVKGCSTYAITGDPRHVHRSSDIDLLHGEPDRLCQTLEYLGYRSTRSANDTEESDKSGSEVGGKWKGDHEFATMVRDDIAIDVHRFFPVVGYPQEIHSAEVTPIGEQGHYIQTREDLQLVGAFRYEDLIAYSMPGMTPETSPLAVPNPAMAAVLLCCHIFRNFVITALHPELLILGDLFDVYDLTQHPQFDVVQFLAITEESSAHDSVAFTMHVLTQLYGHAPFSIRSRREHRFEQFTPLPFPQCLFWSTGTWILPTSLESLLNRDMKSLTEQLGANVLLQKQVPQNALLGPANELKNAIIRNYGKEIGFGVSAQATLEELRFHITVPESVAKDFEGAIFFEYGNRRSVWSYKESALTLLDADIESVIRSKAECFPRGTALEFRFAFPLSELSGCMLGGHGLYLFLGVRQGRGETSMTVVPLAVPSFQRHLDFCASPS